MEVAIERGPVHRRPLAQLILKNKAPGVVVHNLEKEGADAHVNSPSQHLYNNRSFGCAHIRHVHPKHRVDQPPRAAVARSLADP